MTKAVTLADWQAMKDRIHQYLGIAGDYAASRGLTLFPEAENLVLVMIDYHGKALRLEPSAAEAWQKMDSAATKDGIELLPFSGFRSYKYQLDLFKELLAAGNQLDEILKKLAAPGYSEHHTGRALDICAEGFKPTSEDFETSDAFQWLSKHAGDYGFHMSYPRDNKYGFIYEPWHWAYVREDELS